MLKFIFDENYKINFLKLVFLISLAPAICSAAGFASYSTEIEKSKSIDSVWKDYIPTSINSTITNLNYTSTRKSISTSAKVKLLCPKCNNIEAIDMVYISNDSKLSAENRKFCAIGSPNNFTLDYMYRFLLSSGSKTSTEVNACRVCWNCEDAAGNSAGPCCTDRVFSEVKCGTTYNTCLNNGILMTVYPDDLYGPGEHRWTCRGACFDPAYSKQNGLSFTNCCLKKNAVSGQLEACDVHVYDENDKPELFHNDYADLGLHGNYYNYKRKIKIK